MRSHYPPAYYAMKRTAQQRLARGWDPAAILLLGELRAWWGCADKKHAPATEIWRRARRYQRGLLHAAKEASDAR